MTTCPPPPTTGLRRQMGGLLLRQFCTAFGRRCIGTIEQLPWRSNGVSTPLEEFITSGRILTRPGTRLRHRGKLGALGVDMQRRHRHRHRGRGSRCHEKRWLLPMSAQSCIADG